MKKFIFWSLTILMLLIGAGCCIDSRNMVVKDVHVLTSGYYVCYTNGEMVASGHWIYNDGTVKTNFVNKSIYYKTSYVGGPWAGSFIYPATRNVLNHASFMSYSSAASGAYMENIINLPCYPIILLQIPIQFCLDTVLLPFDLINRPHPPEGYELKYVGQ